MAKVFMTHVQDFFLVCHYLNIEVT